MIEVLAAAVPLESGVLRQAARHVRRRRCCSSPSGARSLAQIGHAAAAPARRRRSRELQPAVGMPAFVLLFFALFHHGLSAARRGVPRRRRAGDRRCARSRCCRCRSRSSRSAMFGARLGRGGAIRTAGSRPFAEMFPFSSPFAMAARAANSPRAVAASRRAGVAGAVGRDHRSPSARAGSAAACCNRAAPKMRLEGRKADRCALPIAYRDGCLTNHY